MDRASTTGEDLDAAFDALAERVDPALVIVTATTDDHDSGCLVGFHGQTSIEPRRWTVWISRDNHSHPVVTRARYVGVHFLDPDHRPLAELFGTTTGDEVDKFAHCATVRRRGVPMLADCDAWLLGEVRLRFVADGDHTGLSLAPVEVADPAPGGEPMRFSAAADMQPGHPPES